MNPREVRVTLVVKGDVPLRLLRNARWWQDAVGDPRGIGTIVRAHANKRSRKVRRA